jgi:hypothetical protein
VTGNLPEAEHSVPPRRAGLLASTWVLIGWTVIVGLWIVAEVSPFDHCPTGQGCSTAALMTNDAEIAEWIGAWLVGIVILLLVRWRDLATPRLDVVSPGPRRARWGLITTGSLAGVLAGAHFLLLAPMAKSLFCAQPIRVNRFMAYPLNCDSPLFMKLAQHPRVLLQYNDLRQSRPGYVAVGAVLTRVLGPVASHLGLDRAYGEPTRPSYIPLILINLVVIVAAVALLAWLLGRFGTPVAVVIALCSLLVLNDLMKAFFWTPHQQMFTLLVPLATIAFGRWVILRKPSWPIMATVGFGLGLASLVYANWLITVAVLAIILLARGRRGLAAAAALCGTFAILPVFWIWLCKRLSGSYYNQEVARYHEFIWLPEAAGKGWHALTSGLEVASVGSMREVLGADALVIAVLAGLVVAAVLARVKLTSASPEESALLVASGLTIALSLLFGWGIGIYATRIMFAAFPAILVVIGWVATRFAAKSRVTLLVATYGLAIVAIANALHEVLVHGPYS